MIIGGDGVASRDMATNEHGRDTVQESDERIIAQRASIRRAFPVEKYCEKITPVDNKLEDPDLDEEKDLYHALKERTWAEVPTHLITQLPDGYLLLTDEAFAAVLPAWLMHSLERIDEENQVREFVVYWFSRTMRQFRALNPEQQHTVRSILVEFKEHGTNEYERKAAADAVALIDRRRY